MSPTRHSVRAMIATMVAERGPLARAAMAIAPTVVNGLEISSMRTFSVHREYQLAIAAIAVAMQAKIVGSFIVRRGR